MNSLLIVWVFVLGSVIGSFLNVCIYRIPAGISIVHPSSRCPSCESRIRWWQNIPIFSWLALRGRCANCKSRISYRYPAVEVLTGLLFLQAYSRFGLESPFFVYAFFSAVLVVITFIDLDHQIIPDVISLPGIVIGFVCSYFVPWLSWTESLFGVLLGGGTLYLVAVVYEFAKKVEGMGGGDVKLLAMIGAFLGWKSILPVIFLSSCMGTLVGLPLMMLKKNGGKLAIPFGPFLSATALIYLYWGGDLLRWYAGLMGR